MTQPKIVFLAQPEEYQVTQAPPGWVATGRNIELIVRPGLSSSRIFKRRSVKKGAVNGSTCWLVGELDGVKTYISEVGGKVKVVITREELNP